ncbi:heterokaryon incompatibility protein-domain-containing protein [Xylaria cubensis]|nr:heterokaryon incompatibility protein-domain-containing protein [Xylaria cubensis]
MNYMWADLLSFLDREREAGFGEEESSPSVINGEKYRPIIVCDTSPTLSVEEIIRPARSEGLCKLCRDALQSLWEVLAEIRQESHESPDDYDSDSQGPPQVVYHPHLRLLKELAQYCYLCRLALRNIPKSQRLIFEEKEKDQSKDFRLGLRDNGSFSHPQAFQDSLTEGMISFSLVDYAAAETGQCGTMNLFSTWLIPKMKDPDRCFNPIHRSSTLENSTSGSAASRTLAISWLEACKANNDGNHSMCQRKDVNYIPTRLLDVCQAVEKGLLTVVDTAEHNLQARTEYITLSHCWGELGAKKNPLLLDANLSRLKSDGLKVRELPQTFQDAITVATWFEFRWLWIDCLCIIQDSSNGEDWRREADLMDKTYQNAALNISASVGSDSQAGCFAARENTDILRPQISLRTPDAEKPVTRWTVAEDSFFNDLCRSPSFSRAWIYRERQLSHRILHFCSTGMIWECCSDHQYASSFASEAFPEGFPEFTRDSEPDWKLSRIDFAKPGDIYWKWHQICRQFSEKHLKFRSDMPVIISSLAEEYSHVLPSSDIYISGHWRSQLPYDLAWHTRAADKAESIEATAPSWSWLACRQGKGCFWLESREGDRTSLVDVVNVSTKWKTRNSFGPVDSCVLTVRGVIRAICLDFTHKNQRNSVYRGTLCDLAILDNIAQDKVDIKPTSTIEKSLPRDVHKRVECPAGEPTFKKGRAEVWLDEYREDGELCCFALLLYREPNLRTKAAHQCLLLRQSGPKTFCRIGTMLLPDESALMLHYTWKCTIEKENWQLLGKKFNEEREARKKEIEEKKEHRPLSGDGNDTKRRRLNSPQRQDHTVEQRLSEYHTTVERFFNSESADSGLNKVKPQVFDIK